MKKQTKLSELHIKRTELHKYIKDLDHQVYTEMRLLNDRWAGYKILRESSYEAEGKDWYGEESESCKKMTGEGFELWNGTAADNAEYLKKAAIEHAKKATTTQTKKEAAERELEQNWKDIKEEEVKKEEVKS